MNTQEIDEHFEFLDGIQKAQMIVLRALLREQPELKEKIAAYAAQLEANPPAEGLSEIQLSAMKTHLQALTR